MSKVKREGAITAAAAGSGGSPPAAAAAAASSSASGAASADRKKKPVDRAERIVFPHPPDGHTFRVMISTDNHLGYLESDPVRADDSFASFREMLQAAKDNQVDFVLLGGDLFHDNKPTRSTLCKTVNILRQFTFGENPITFEIISDQQRNFPTTKICNYEDPNVNVALPIFSIHGNHDDPSGAGAYSTMDLLHSCSLLNYFVRPHSHIHDRYAAARVGKIDRVDHIVNYPILITKGDSKLALYGMGNVRDERLHRTFEMDGVKWDKPQQDPAGWFNLAVVHQNRTRHTITQRDFLPEKFLPQWLDMVVWGHEHECIAEPQESVEGQYFVLQPGSSVATSLSGGESVEKKVVIMEIMGDQYRTVPIPLHTVRPFVIADVKLSDDLDPLDANPQQIEEYLTDKINEIITSIKRDPRYSNADRPELPLVRLRVEHTGFPRITNINKFGQRFIGKVANPDDLLLFSKQKAVASKGKGDGSKAADDKQLDAFLHADRADKIPPIQELVKLLIRQQASQLAVLTEQKMAECVDDFVNRKDLDAIEEGVRKSIKHMTITVKAEPALAKDSVKPDDVERVIRKKHSEMTAVDRKNEGDDQEKRAELAEMFGIDLNLDAPETMREGKEGEDAMDDDADMDDGAAKKKPKPRAKAGAGTGRGKAASSAAASKAKPAARGRKKIMKDESDDEEPEEIDDEDDVPMKKKAAPRKKKVIAESDDDDGWEAASSAAASAAADDDDGADPDAKRPAKKSRTAAPKTAVRMTAAAAAAKPAPSPNKKRGRAAPTLNVTSTTVSNPFAAASRKPTAAAASDMIDLSQLDDAPAPPVSRRAPAAAASAAAPAETMEDEPQELDSASWGQLPKMRGK